MTNPEVEDAIGRVLLAGDGTRRAGVVFNDVRAERDAARGQLRERRERVRVLTMERDRLQNALADLAAAVNRQDRAGMATALQAATEVLASSAPGPLGERRDVNGELTNAVQPGAWKDTVINPVVRAERAEENAARFERSARCRQQKLAEVTAERDEIQDVLRRILADVPELTARVPLHVLRTVLRPVTGEEYGSLADGGS